ncbi:UNVERIFIED_CONTAM: hypothetical protein FKN15_072808 [Acipenser sinensis]
MSATRYRRFLRLCEEWPIDETKRGRDLATFLRQKVALAFREGESTQITDPEKCDQMYESLARIHANVYKEKFPRVRDTSFTGVTVEECRVVLATGSAHRYHPIADSGGAKMNTQSMCRQPPASLHTAGSPCSHLRATASEDNAAYKPQAPGQTTVIAGAQ